MIPEDLRSNFIWTPSEQLEENQVDPTRPIAISAPGTFLGTKWSLVRILDLIDSCEYSLDRCEMVDSNVAELHVVAWSYPYGGLNALIALVEQEFELKK